MEKASAALSLLKRSKQEEPGWVDTAHSPGPIRGTGPGLSPEIHRHLLE
jgi:hypothetical protein